jgi:DNA-binding NtrC family response regulator
VKAIKGEVITFPPQVRGLVAEQRALHKISSSDLRPPRQTKRLDCVYYRVIHGVPVMSRNALALFVALGLDASLMDQGQVSQRPYLMHGPGKIAVALGQGSLSDQRQALIQKLRAAKGKVNAVAAELGVSRTALYDKMQTLEISGVDLARIRYGGDE